MDVSNLAQQCGAAPEFLGKVNPSLGWKKLTASAGRILRYLGSVHLVIETGGGKFAANQFTRVLADPPYEAGICFGSVCDGSRKPDSLKWDTSFDSMGPLMQALPDFFASTGYQDITDGRSTIFQKAFKTEMPAYEWLAAHPDRFASLQRFMTVQRFGDWTSISTLRDELEEWSRQSETVAFVDIGGGAGQQCVRLKERLPSLHGRIVLQDLPEVITRLPTVDGVDSMGHDFFQPQKVKGGFLFSP